MHHPSTSVPRATGEAGFSLIEGLLGLVILAVGLLSHASLTMAEHRLSREQQLRSEGLHVARQLVERLRSDEDWAGLYDRLRARQALADTPSSADALRLEDGREAFVPQAYFPDFALSRALPQVHVLIDVPSGPDPVTPGGPAVLREDVTAPAYGLPADLDADGTVDADAHDGDYVVLPVRVTILWTPAGEAARQLTLPVWLRGRR